MAALASTGARNVPNSAPERSSTTRGVPGRALGASYMSALIGGLFGAALMAVTLPILRPIILYIGSPELLSVAVFGISMVSVLSGSAPLRGLTAACFGMMLAMIGTDPQSGTLRWTLDTLYLWDGMPLVPFTLGIFALPELCDLAISRMAVVGAGELVDTKSGMLLGVKDCMRHWFLILRCAWIGSAMGSSPRFFWISRPNFFAASPQTGAPPSTRLP